MDSTVSLPAWGIGAALVMLAGLAQLILVPMVAKDRGRDGAVWFIVALLWTLSFGGCGALYGGWFAAAVIGARGADDLIATVLGLGCFAGPLFLPLCVLAVLVRRAGPPKRARGARRRTKR